MEEIFMDIMFAVGIILIVFILTFNMIILDQELKNVKDIDKNKKDRNIIYEICCIHVKDCADYDTEKCTKCKFNKNKIMKKKSFFREEN